MRKFRKMVAAAVGLAMLAQPALAQPRCLQAAERTAFDVGALKSQLMVVALTCQQHDRYDAFVNRFRTQLVAEERVQGRYFARAGGRRAQDDYITGLANLQAQEGIRRGSFFCREQMPLFDRVMAVQNPRDLPTFATGNRQPTVMTQEVCAAPAPRRPATTTAARPARTAASGTSAAR